MTNQNKNIYIVGGNGFARECCNYINRMKEKDDTIVFKGFLGEGGYKADLVQYSSYWIADESEFDFGENDYAVIGSGDSKIRKRIYQNLKKRNVKFFTVVDPSVILFDYSDIGEANIFTYNCLISTNVAIGNGNLFNGNIDIGHDATIGDFNFIAPNCHILGSVTIGNSNSIGCASAFLPYSKIGSDNKVVPGSVIYKGFKDNSYISGNPARKIGEIDENSNND